MVRDRFDERWRKTQESHLRPTERPRKTRATRAKTPIETAAERFGLSAKGRGVIGGHVAGLEVKVRCRIEDETTWHATINAPDLPHKFALHAETALSVMKKSIAGEDVLTFDDLFDRAVSVSGPQLATVAVLDHFARKNVLTLLPRGLIVRERRIELAWTTKREAAPTREHAAELRRAVALAKRMSLDDRPIAQRLLRNVRRDPNECVRLNNLSLLLRSDDPYSKRPLPREGILRVIALALHQQDPLVSSLARTALIEDALELLVHVNAGDADLVRFSERGLLALFSIARADAKLLIVEALGRVGTDLAVEVLLPHASGLFVRAALKQSVRKAIALIEERAGANRGRLSVVPFVEHQGTLALTKGEGGLALSDEDEEDDDEEGSDDGMRTR